MKGFALAVVLFTLVLVSAHAVSAPEPAKDAPASPPAAFPRFVVVPLHPSANASGNENYSNAAILVDQTTGNTWMTAGASYKWGAMGGGPN